MADLTDKQRAFCKEYIVDFNAAQAAIRAGYAPKHAKDQAHKLMQLPHIQEGIRQEVEQRMERTEIKADQVVQQIYKQAFADIRDFISWEDVLMKAGYDPDTDEPVYEHQRIIRFREMDQVDGTLISELRETKDGIVFKRNDPLKSQELLMRHLGLLQDKSKVELTGEGGGGINIIFDIPRPDWSKKEEPEEE